MAKDKTTFFLRPDGYQGDSYIKYTKKELKSELRDDFFDEGEILLEVVIVDTHKVVGGHKTLEKIK